KRIFSGEGPAKGEPQELPRAVALGYDPQHDLAPVVLASGQGHIAEQIIALGREKGVPMLEDEFLVAALAQVDVGEAIPPELYAVVARVLAYIYRLRGKGSREKS